MTTATLEQVARAFAGLKAIPMDKVPALQKLLDEAPTEALWALYDRRVEFLWCLAYRRLVERGEVKLGN